MKVLQEEGTRNGYFLSAFCAGPSQTIPALKAEKKIAISGAFLLENLHENESDLHKNKPADSRENKFSYE